MRRRIINTYTKIAVMQLTLIINLSKDQALTVIIVIHLRLAIKKAQIGTIKSVRRSETKFQAFKTLLT
jgi:hypothetical protein